MKTIITILVLLFTVTSFAQAGKIVKLLNQQFLKEQKMYSPDDYEKPTLVQPFQIKNDTLSFEFFIASDYTNDHVFHIRRTVNLKDIKSFAKDMNILFIGDEESVQEIRVTKNTSGEVMKTEQVVGRHFFTELRKDYRKDKKLQKKMMEAFAKAGYNITSEHWYD